MRTFIDPYLPPIFECEESLDTVDLCDSSGYLPPSVLKKSC